MGLGLGLGLGSVAAWGHAARKGHRVGLRVAESPSARRVVGAEPLDAVAELR